MAKQQTRATPDQSKANGGRSVLAVLAGICAWLVVMVSGFFLVPLHSLVFVTMPFAVFTYGFVIGIIDRWRPYWTGAAALLAIALAGSIPLAIPLSQAGWTGMQNLVVTIVVPVVLAMIVGIIGVACGRQIIAGRHPRTWWVVYALAFVAAFGYPWYSLQWQGARFMAQRETEVRRFLEEHMLNMKHADGPWGTYPSRAFPHMFGSSLRTQWDTSTETAGTGQCTLEVRMRRLRHDTAISSLFDRMDLHFRPASSANLRSPKQALSLLDDLGITLEPKELQPANEDGWEGDIGMRTLPVGVAWVKFRIHASGEVEYSVERYWDT